MLTELCAHLNNYFVREIHAGTYAISDGSIGDVPFLIDGQYFRIVGSVLNDGVYKYPATDLKDETFEGQIWAMAVPPAVIALSQEIDDWVTANANALNSPYQSESFGGYSYSVKGGSVNSNGQAEVLTWQAQFRSRLNPWRKI